MYCHTFQIIPFRLCLTLRHGIGVSRRATSGESSASSALLERTSGFLYLRVEHLLSLTSCSSTKSTPGSSRRPSFSPSERKKKGSGLPATCIQSFLYADGSPTSCILVETVRCPYEYLLVHEVDSKLSYIPNQSTTRGAEILSHNSSPCIYSMERDGSFLASCNFVQY